MKSSKHSFIISIIITGIVVFIISKFFFQIIFVAGDSMNSTYNNQDIVLVSKFNVTSHINYNDVLVINSDSVNQTIIKRVIALPGDTVQITDRKVYVNGSLYNEIQEFDPIDDSGLAASPVILGDNQYFVLGDNRNASIDSRFETIGVIPASSIIGKVIFSF